MRSRTIGIVGADNVGQRDQMPMTYPNSQSSKFCCQMFVRSSALPTVPWVVWGYGWGTQNGTSIAVQSLKILPLPARFEARLLKKLQNNIYMFFFPTACAHIVLALWCAGIDH